MACYAPLAAMQADDGTVVLGKFGDDCLEGKKLSLPCGKCEGCLLERSRQWATRCTHEAQMHEYNCMVNLTYADENLPENNSLKHRDFQLFMKRLRKKIDHTQRPNGLQIPSESLLVDGKLAFYMCGEYGDKTERPHYHAALFGVDFKDKEYHSKTAQGHKLYTSKTLDKLWQQGHALIGTVTYESAAYIARYVMKKMGKQQAIEKNKIQEYNKMSRNPGLGKTWIDKYTADVYPQGTIIINGGIKVKPPKYYDNRYKNTEENQYEEMKIEREIQAKKQANDNTPSRLAVKQQVTKAQLNRLKRDLK